MYTNKALLLSILILITSGAASAAPATSRLLGGVSVKEANTAFAQIYSPKGSCSGTLVASDLVLTAAHCLNADAKDYAVTINNQTLAVKEFYYHSSFKQNGSYTLSKASFDIGILVLAENVYSTVPLPIVYNLPVSKGTTANLTAFGLSEKSSHTASEGLRTGKITVETNYDDLLYFNATKSAATSCYGDSGGAILQNIKNYGQWLIAVDVAGSNSADENGNCTLKDGGQSYSVNLQSQQSRAFLNWFPSIRFVNWADVASDSLTDRFKHELNKIKKLPLKKSRIRIQKLRNHVKQLIVLASADKTVSLKKISSQLRSRSSLFSRNHLIKNLQRSKAIAIRQKRHNYSLSGLSK